MGALLMANLLGEAISRQLDQPGNGGGNWFAFDSDGWRIIEGWRSMIPDRCLAPVNRGLLTGGAKPTDPASAR